VQGVGYREGLCNEAYRRGVTGWVRNRSDGTVEALLQGTREAVEAMMAWARRGPPAASVDEVRSTAPAGPVPTFSAFERRPTS
jgi:acylphosphatase